MNKEKDIEIINPDINIGLSDDEVKRRISDGLINKISKTVTKSIFKIIFDNVFNFFNIILFGVAIFLICIGAKFTDLMFFYLLLINIAIGLFQDIKARQKVKKLKVVSYPIVKVLRNGNILDIPANQLVLSDIVILKNGDQIIADGTLVEGSLEVNESLLTGESLNIHKNVNSFVLSGSYVTSGTAKVRIDRVGKANYAETLQSKARKFKRPKSEILRSLKRIFFVIGFVVVTLGIAMLVTYISKGQFSGQNIKTYGLQFAGSIVAMVPIGMYLLTSLTLAVGVIRLAKKRTLVQELYCIETLARVDTLCLDKTGTITDGTMSLKQIKILSKDNKDDIENVLYTLVNATKDENSTAMALLNGLKNKSLLSFLKGLPFSSKRKYSGVMLNDGRTFVLGAREFLPHSNDIDSKFEEYEKQGYRVLMLALSKTAITDDGEFGKLTPVAIVVLEDHIKEDAPDTIKWFKENGVTIKIISGDNPISVAEIARRVGVEGYDRYISLESMPIEEVKAIANKYTVFGRVSPEQKEALVSAMQEDKHVVAMTGDGVNDILALKVADCSIAMAKGSDAAKAVAHLVSMDSNFSSLPSVVREGRRVINNLQRTCSVFLIKTMFAMVLTAVFLVSSWLGKRSYPFVTNNLYVWELLTIGFASFFLSLQPNDERINDTFLNNILTKSLPGGIIQSSFVLIFFLIYVCNPTFLSFEGAKLMSVLFISIMSFATLMFICYPFDVYRSCLCIAIGILMCCLFAIDYCVLYANHESFFRIDYSQMNQSNWWILLIMLFVGFILYFVLNKVAIHIKNRIVGKHNENRN